MSGFHPEVSRPAVSGKDWILVSPDRQLTTSVHRILQESFGFQARIQNEVNLAGITDETVLMLDMRTLNEQVLRQQQEEAEAVPAITISLSAEDAQLPSASPRGGRSLHLRLPVTAERFTKALQYDVLQTFSQNQNSETFRVRFSDFTYQTTCAELHRHLENLLHVAKHDVAVLLIGETGTGKTTLAREIHRLSGRKDDVFLTVACGALPGTLIETELFGHVKGAFTGANEHKQGKFEVASSGSLLLDEVDVLDLNQQTKLLRIIETGEFEPVGSNQTLISKARLIAASNRPLEQLVDEKKFRDDLYYRLNVLEFRIPPLRERPADIVPLALEFVCEVCRSHDVKLHRIHPDFLERCSRYHWPGNLRQLKNHMRRAVLFARNSELTLNDLPREIAEASTSEESCQRSPETLQERVAVSERQVLQDALKAHGFKRIATAKALGISRVCLYNKMRKYGMLKDGKEKRE